MKKKFLILLAVVISFIPSICFLIIAPEYNNKIFAILKITLLFVAATATFSLMLFYFIRLFKRHLTFNNCYIISAGILLLIFFLWGIWRSLYNTSGEKSYESIRNGDDTDYDFRSKEYYSGTTTIKEEIIVVVKHNKGDSTIIYYDKEGNIISNRKFKISR
jgi:hypothetical protein